MTVREQIEAFLSEWPDAEFSPAHIVLSDYNLADGHIRWCIGLCRAALSGQPSDLVEPTSMRPQIQVPDMSVKMVESGDVQFMDGVDWYRTHDREELTETLAFLEKLLKIPEVEREF